MDTSTSTSALSTAVLTLMLSCLTSASDDLHEVKVRPGQDATLQCQGPDGTVRLLQWSRPDLQSSGYVFFYRGQRLVESFQHPSFHRRVQLRDPDMKNGDASVILKNVNINDTGRYECCVSVTSRVQRKRATPETMSIIILMVEDSGHTLGNTHDGKYRHLHVGAIPPVIVFLIVLIVLVGLVNCKKSKRQMENNSVPPTPSVLDE